MNDTTTDDYSEPRLRDLFRRTWELELLISGAVAFALTRVPGALDRLFDRLSVHLSPDLFLLAFYGYTYPKLITITLIATFVIHLSARAYWVGLIGLQSVFPWGIRWSELRYGPATVATYRRILPRLETLARQADAFCSVLFSFAFVIVFIFALSLGVLGPAIMVSIGISIASGGAVDTTTVFFAIVVIAFGPMMLLQLADKATAARGIVGAKRPRWLERLIRWNVVFSQKMYLGDLYTPILLTFSSNLPKRVATTVLLTLIFTMSAGIVFWDLFRSTGAGLHGSRYFPMVAGTLEMDNDVYRDRRPDDVVFRTVPSIQSTIISDPHVELWMPYYGRRDDEVVEALCPDLEALVDSRITIRPPSPDVPDLDRLEAVRECMSRIADIRLDGDPLVDLDWRFSRGPGNGVPILVAFIPVRDLGRGAHDLSIRRQIRPVAPDGDADDVEDHFRVFTIPFWL
jgi:hypothetical protein